MTQIEREISENDQLRADIYQLLAALLRRHPSEELLQFLADLDVEADEGNAMNQAWIALKTAAKTSDVAKLEDEYFSIFLGVGCGNSGFESIQQGLNLCLGHSAAFRLGIRVAVRLGIRSRSRRRVVETIPSAGRIPDRGRLNGGRLRGVENV
mgnify:FL=1